MMPGRWLALLFWLAGSVRAESLIVMAGTFNDWNPTNTAYALAPVGDDEYSLTQFFRAGRHAFKFTFDGGWKRHLGEGPAGKLVQPGAEVPLVLPAPGAYRITLRLRDKTWRWEPAELTEPRAVVEVRGPVEVNLPITLDAAGSVARRGHTIQRYRFEADTNNLVRAGLLHAAPDQPQAVVILPAEGTYRFHVRVDDGMESVPEPITLRALTSYQLLGQWTGTNPLDPATFLRRTGPASFERLLRTGAPGQQTWQLVRNHDATAVVTTVTVQVTATNTPFWRVDFDEREGRLRVAPESWVEFRFDPNDFPALAARTSIDSVTVAGSFNHWSRTATPLERQDDGTYVGHVKLAEGLHYYKFVVNGNVWLYDPRADAELRVPDGHNGFNSGLFVGEHGRSFGAPAPDAVNFAAVRHDPDQPWAVTAWAGDSVEVKLRTLAGDVTEAAVEVDGTPLRMRREDSRAGFDWWSGTVTLTQATETLRYRFVLRDGTARVSFPTNGEPFSVVVTNRFLTPEWARHVVWYQIFPERFRNGSPANDPPGTLPWRWDWYRLAPGEPPLEGKRFSTAWYSRWFGGDLQGVREKLPYLKQLGVTALYLCPIFEAGAYHGYDTLDYRHVARHFGVREPLPAGETLDPATWQWTESDKLFLELIHEAHRLGLKVIVDGVFNHMGKGNFALNDVLSNGVESAYADWFDITDWGPPVRYKSWDGGGWMPNFRKNEEHGIASATARQYLFDITRRWMDPNGDGDPSDGVDGWRLDVAADVPDAFWRAWRQHVKSINPHAYICGEHWGEAPRHLQGDQWDAVMNYQFAMRAIRFFIDRQRKITASELDRQLRQLLALYPMPVNLVMQNLYDSHDTDRLVSMIINPDRDYDGCNRPQDGCPYDERKPGPAAYRVMKLMTTFQMTFLGAPMIWYGNEAGMFGADDPTTRKPMLWKDLQPYDNPQDIVMDDIWQHFARLIAIRNTYPALRVGTYEAVLTDDVHDLFAFRRSRGTNHVVVAINNSTQRRPLAVPVPWANDQMILDILNSPAHVRPRPMGELGFPQFPTDARLPAIEPLPATRRHRVRQGRVTLELEAKSAAILVAP